MVRVKPFSLTLMTLINKTEAAEEVLKTVTVYCVVAKAE